MITKYILLLISFLELSIQSFGINHYSENDTLIVLAKMGIKLRESAEDNGKIILSISRGEKVRVLESKYAYERLYDSYRGETGFEEQIPESCTGEVSDIFTLRGRRVKVDYNGHIGYVADCYLSKYRPIGDDEKLIDYFDSVFIRLHEVIEYQTEGCVLKKILYSNGLLIDIINDCGEGYSWTNTYIFPLSFEEAYYIFIRNNQCATFKGIKEKKYIFEEELGGFIFDNKSNYLEITHWWSN